MIKFRQKPFGDDRLTRDKYMEWEDFVLTEQYEEIIVNGSLRNYREDEKSEREGYRERNCKNPQVLEEML